MWCFDTAFLATEKYATIFDFFSGLVREVFEELFQA
jgi:hypothetical protein